MREYLVDHNATQAAIRAGYSRESAESQGSRLLRNDKVQAEINAGDTRVAERAELSAERVLRELQTIGFAELEQPDRDAGTWPLIRASDKLKALELLGKHLKLFVDRQALEDPDGAPLSVQIIRKVAK